MNIERSLAPRRWMPASPAFSASSSPASTLPPLEALLVSGGDARLALDPITGLNPYGCSSTPRPEAIDFASSTASSISLRAFLRAERTRQILETGGIAQADILAEAARVELLRLLGLDADVAVVFTPSGTDAALAALAVARMGSRGPLASIVAAADATGRGMPKACFGRHFGALTARGRGVTAGDGIAGFEDVQGIAVPMHDASGSQPRAATDRAVVDAVERAIAAGQRVVLYAMDHSKLGGHCPGNRCLDEIAGRFGDAVQIVIDACQARIGRSRLRAHLAAGRMVLLTGSKFFAGPPLSGALLLPPGLAQTVAACEPPAGLRDYARAGDWPAAFGRVRAALDPEPNLGQLLRWSAALEEMAAFFAMPLPHRRAALAAFADAVPQALAAFEEFTLLPEGEALDLTDDEFPVRTIFPFTVQTADAALSAVLCGKLYRALNADVRALLPPLKGEERRVAALPCHIGQPVAIGATGALRVSASARLLQEPERIEAGLRAVFAKLRLLVRHRDVIERAF